MAEVRARYPRVFEKPTPPTPEEIEARRLEDEDRARRQDAARREAQAAYRRQFLAEFLKRVGPRYAGATLDSYQVTTSEQRKVLAAVRAYGENLVDRVVVGDGVVLYGPPGTGKDHLLIGLAQLAIERSWFPQWENGLELYGRFREQIGGADESERELIEQYTTPKVLILSDAIPPVGAVTPYQAATLYRILDTRYRECRPTWASLNVASAEEADARMGAAIVDRLTHGALVLQCSWPSYRRPATRGEGVTP